MSDWIEVDGLKVGPHMRAALKLENDELRQQLDQKQADLDRALARADACQREAQIWKQEARTQSAIVAEIYQELTDKTGEPGDWNGARPLRPAILRKQAEAIEDSANTHCNPSTKAALVAHLLLDAKRLREKADQMEADMGEVREG